MSIIRANFSTFLDRFHLSETTTLVLSAVGVGAGTGLGAVLFIKLISLVDSMKPGGMDSR